MEKDLIFKYYVYHISDNDNLFEGYIGVSKQPSKRWKQHMRANSTVGKTIREGQWSYHTHLRIIYEGSKEECFSYEKHLRNKSNIGLNEAVGGLGGDIVGLGERWKKERIGIGNPNYGLKRTDETKRKMSDSMKSYYKSILFTKEKLSVYKEVLSKTGAEAIRNTVWWNNGIKNKRAKESPGSGWNKGRIPFQRTYKDTTFYATKQKSKCIVIDGTYYFSISEASRKTGKCRQTIRKMINDGRI